MKYLILAGATLGYFLSLILIGNRPIEKRKAYLLVYLLCNSTILLGVFLELLGKGEIFLLPAFMAQQILMPLFYSYITLLLGQKIQQPGLFWIPLCCSVFSIVLFTLIYPGAVIESSLVGTHPLLYWPVLWELLLPPLVIIRLHRVLTQFQKELKNRMSFTEGIDFRWVRMLLVLELTVWLLMAFLDQFILPFFKQDPSRFLELGFSLASLLLIYLAYYGVSRTGAFSRHQLAQSEEPSGETPALGLSLSRMEEVEEVILHLMEQKHCYRDSRLSLSGLTAKTSFRAHHLSETISRRMNTTFYDLINRYRSLEVMERINRGEHRTKTLLALALDSGFNSKASFNRNFKIIAHMTPSDYLKTRELKK